MDTNTNTGTNTNTNISTGTNTNTSTSTNTGTGTGTNTNTKTTINNLLLTAAVGGLYSLLIVDILERIGEGGQREGEERGGRDRAEQNM